MILALTFMLATAWEIVPGFPDTYETPFPGQTDEPIKHPVAWYSNPTTSDIFGTTSDKQFEAEAWVTGTENAPDGEGEIENPEWSANYAELYNRPLRWTAYATTYRIRAMHTLNVYYTTKGEQGAETWSLIEMPDLRAGRNRVVHKDLKGEFQILKAIEPDDSEDGDSGGPASGGF